MEWAAIAIVIVVLAVYLYKKVTKSKKRAKHKDDIYPLW